MTRIAVCDDDPQMRAYVKNTIQKARIICQIAEFSDGAQLLRNYKNYDILFLDIDMPVLNGIDAAVSIRSIDKKVKIIYVTGYEDYMQRSFGVHPFSFLVKPVSEQEIERQLRDAISYETEEAVKSILRFQTDTGIEELKVPEIYYLEYAGRRILRLVTKKGEYAIKGRITEYIQKLEDYGFSCPHKSFTVNLYYVKAIRGYDIFMVNGDRIPLSQKRSAAFRSQLGRLQADCI